jgi:DNA-binding response OmpR family regulator
MTIGGIRQKPGRQACVPTPTLAARVSVAKGDQAMLRQVLVIENDDGIAEQINAQLSLMSCKVKHVHDGRLGLAEAVSGSYDLLILDMAPPAIDGLEICRRIRGSEHYMPIIMLSSRSTELDHVLGLELGADHYVTKPFSVLELVARTKAIFRLVDRLASVPADEPGTIKFKNLKIDVQRHEVTIGGKPVDLTAKEFQLLLYFARSPGRVYTRGQLLDQVWGYNHSGYEHTVNSHINRLRAKIEENPYEPEYIQTIWGVGYKFQGQTQEWDAHLREAA